MRVLSCLFFAALTLPVRAADVAAPAPAVGAASLVQVAFGLLVVVALILGTAWIGRRLGLARASEGRLLNVVASTAVGTRERVVVIETGDTWLVVGVAPGSVNHLATLPRGEIAPVVAGAAHPGFTASPFAAKLASLMGKHDAKR